MVAMYYKPSKKVEAVQWSGDNLMEVAEFLGIDVDLGTSVWENFDSSVKNHGLFVYVKSGRVCLNIGDYLIKTDEDLFDVVEKSTFESEYLKPMTDE